MENLMKNNYALKNEYNRVSIPSLFVKLALFLGFLIVFLTPPMCAPDENYHFLNAYAISNGAFFPEVVNGVPGKYVRKNMVQFTEKYNGKFAGKLDEKYSFKEQYFNGYLKDSDESLSFYTRIHNPIVYFPASFAMAVGQRLGEILNLPLLLQPFNILIYGRIGNLLFYISIIYLALKRTPYYRRTIFVLSMMPMSLFLGSVNNYDAIIIPVCFLLLSEVFKLLSDKTNNSIKKDDILCTLFCTLMLVSVKQVYAFILLTLLAIPKAKYGSNKKMIICIIAVLITGIVAYIPTLVINQLRAGVVDNNTTIIQEQTSYILNHLSQMPSLIIYTLGKYRLFYLEGFWGKLGQLDTNLPIPIAIIFYATLLFSAVIEGMTSKIWNRWYIRILPLFAVLAAGIGIFLSMYRSHTPLPGIAEGVGSSYISGVQGRYFIELFLPLCSVFSFNKFGQSRLIKRCDCLSETISVACAVLCGLFTPITIFVRYWV